MLYQRNILLGPKLWSPFRNYEENTKGKQLKAVSVENFQHPFQEWEHLCWCVAFQRNYFQGDKVENVFFSNSFITF